MRNNTVEAIVEKKGHEIVDILGVRVVSTRMNEVIETIETEIKNMPKKRPFFIVTVNPEFVVRAQKDRRFKKILNEADLAIPDGWGLVWASGGKIAESVPGRKVVLRLLELRKYKVFYLGGWGGEARELAERYGGKWDAGHADVRLQLSDTKVNTKLVAKINRYRPDILLVAYGAPWQEEWIAANLDTIKAKVVMGVGGTFDYLTGRAKLPPVWMERWHLEWLWRLVQEPWRWRRQLALVRFGAAVLRRRITQEG